MKKDTNRFNFVAEPNKKLKAKTTIQPLKGEDKKRANVEGEGLEMILGPLGFDGLPELYQISGKSHAEGGAPLSVPDNSFFFSKDKSTRITDPDIQKMFGKKEKKKGYTPAEIAKQYKMNEYKLMLQDKNSDDLQKKTAKTMIENYNHKLGKLALVQEADKGFPDGIPMVATPYLIDMGIDPEGIVNGSNDPNQPTLPGAPEMRKGGTLRVKIVGVPKMQKGGGKPKTESKSNFFLNPGFEKGDEFYNAEKYIYPTNLGADKGQVQQRQAAIRGKKNIHGDTSLDSPEVMNDFKSRFPDYLQWNPDFDPHNPGHVKDFQSWHANESKQRGLSPYFIPPGQTKTVNDIDSLWGQHTAYAPGFKQTTPQVQQPAAVTPETQMQAPPIVGIPGVNPVAQQQDNPFWTQDLVNLGAATGEYAGIKKYNPWASNFETQTNKPVFFDPTRELAANEEGANASLDVLSRFADPSSISARASQVQGNALKGAGDILGRYNNLNVDVANQTQAGNTAILNEASRTKAQQATKLYDDTVHTNQSFDNARRLASRNIKDAFNTAWTNRGQTQALNSMQKHYRLDPKTGFVNFNQGSSLDDLTQKEPNHMDQLKGFYEQLMQNPNMQKNPEHAKILMSAMMQSMGFKP